jgi:hypothetical protein
MFVLATDVAYGTTHKFAVTVLPEKLQMLKNVIAVLPVLVYTAVPVVVTLDT